MPEHWLRGEELRAAERLDQLIRDYELVTDLAWSNFHGERNDYFATELAKYGLAVMRGWMRSGVILRRCRDRGLGGLPAAPEGAFLDHDTVAGLADETVSKALRHFREGVLMTRKWDYRRGASLRTYFIGQCLIRFANVYRRWHSHERRAGRLTYTDGDLAALGDVADRRTPSVEQLVTDQAQVDGALKAIRNPRVKQALVLHAAGLPHDEIAERLDTTAKAVERMIANERDRMQKRGIA